MPPKSEKALEHKRQYHRDLYAWYKEHGICAFCHTRYVAPGRIYCECCTKEVKARSERRDPGRAKRKAYCKEYRERKIAEGLCVNCGRRPAREGHTFCEQCARKKNECEQVRRIRNRIRREAQKREGAPGLDKE